MKHLILLFFFMILSPILLEAQSKENNTSLSPEAKYIFQYVKTKLNIAEKNFFGEGYKLKYDAESNDTSLYFFDKDDTTLNDETVSVYISPVDLNKDGVEEIFIQDQSGFFGPQIQDQTFYIKNNKGDYVLQKDVSSPGFFARATSFGGYPDLIGGAGGGPGFNYKVPTRFNVYRWDGKEYKLFKKNQPHLKTDRLIAGE